MDNILAKFRVIETFIFDVDGVFTDGKTMLLESGKLLRQFHMRDSYAVERAVAQGYRVGIITRGRSEGVRKHFETLGVTDLYTGITDKLEAYEEYLYTYELDDDKILYMGDDHADFPVMTKVGLPTCPQDAAHELTEIAEYVSPYGGGAGAVRDVIEKVLAINDHWITPPIERFREDWRERLALERKSEEEL